MRPLSARLGPLYVWQALLLLAVLIGAGLGVYFYAPGGSEGSTGGLEEGEQLVPVQRGTLLDAVTTSGTVVFPEREEVSFAVGGEVAEVLVRVGSVVQAGDTLARLSPAAIASLEQEVLRAHRDLRDAQEALNDALALPDESEATAANEALERSRRALQNAADDLERTMQNAATQEAELRTRLQDAHEAEEEAGRDYAKTFEQWLGIEASGVDLFQSPAALLGNWQVDLSALLDGRLGLSHRPGVSGLPDDDPATVWDERVLYTWRALYPGAVAATCSAGPPSGVRCAEHDMEQAWAALEDARAAVQDAQASLDDALVKAAQDILANEEAVARAEEALAADEDQALDAAQPGEELDVALLRAAVSVAEHALVGAQEDLLDAALAAPFAGIVEEVSMEAGDQAAAQGAPQPFITVVDPSVVEVDGSVDEIDILAVAMGMPVSVSLSALEGQLLSGEIVGIGGAEAGQLGVVTFPVTFRLSLPAGLVLREGLSAVSEIVIAEYDDVLLVPTSSVSGSITAPAVRVSADGAITERPVTLGPSDDFWVMVLEGLVEGEQVVMPEPAAAGGGFGGFGGVFGPGARALPRSQQR